MYRRRVNRDGLLGVDVLTVLEVDILAFFLSLQLKTSQATEVLLHNSLVERGAATDTLTIVARHPTDEKGAVQPANDTQILRTHDVHQSAFP